MIEPERPEEASDEHDAAGMLSGQSLPPEGPAARFAHSPIYVSGLVVCQDAFRDTRGRTHLHALFDNLNATIFPVQAQFMVWCSVKGRGQTHVSLKIIDAEGLVLAATEPVPAEVTPFKGHEVFFGFTVQLPRAGLFKVIALLDGVPSMEVPLMVRHSPPPDPSGQ